MSVCGALAERDIEADLNCNENAPFDSFGLQEAQREHAERHTHEHSNTPIDVAQRFQ